jgi:hypothetical protein
MVDRPYDVDATTAIRQAEGGWSGQDGARPYSYGSAQMLGWLVEERGIDRT